MAVVNASGRYHPAHDAGHHEYIKNNNQPERRRAKIGIYRHHDDHSMQMQWQNAELIYFIAEFSDQWHYHQCAKSGYHK